jgi:Ca-activated chloride channel family protein
MLLARPRTANQGEGGLVKTGKMRQLGMFLALLWAAACSQGPDKSSPSAPPARGGDNYGDDLIGYMNASARDAPNTETDQNWGAQAGAPVDGDADGDSDGEGGGGGDEHWYPPGSGGAADGGIAPEWDADAGDSSAIDADSDSSIVDAGGDSSITDANSDSATIDASVDSSTVDASVDPEPDSSTPEPSQVPENPYFSTSEEPISTFSIDVDTGSYTLSRGYINNGHLPPPESVRIEEFINYFHFHYRQPKESDPFSVYAEMGPCPWNADHELVMVGIQGQEIDFQEQPPVNLVFLIDVSGSMGVPDKLPLLKKGLRMLVRQLRAQDRISIVTYASRDAVVLDGVPGNERETILEALDGLSSGGSTNGSGGIQKAYEIALEHYIEGGNNRVLLATDGDFNVGITGEQELVDFIAAKRDSGVFLSVYGFGGAWGSGYNGNYQDSRMEQLADNGNGVYFYIDGPEEARRAFLYAVSGSLLTIAKDVKVQIEFNPEHVAGYRLIGYENRVLANADFSNDSVDAGELGAGLSVTAFFEVIPAGSSEEIPTPLPGTIPEIEASGGTGADGDGSPPPTEEFEPVTGSDIMEVRIRYKERDAEESQLVRLRFDNAMVGAEPSLKFLFGAGVSEFAMRLRGSQYLPSRETASLLEQVGRARVIDGEGAVAELITLIEEALSLGF